MANKSFVVQYLIKAREQFSAAADKVRRSSEGMTKSVDQSKKAMVALSAKTEVARQKLKQVSPLISSTSSQWDKFKKSTQRSKTSMGGLLTKIAAVDDKLQRSIPTFKSATGAMQGLNAAGLRAQASLRKIEQRFEGISFVSGKIRNAGLALSVGLTLPLGLMAKSFKNAARDAIESRSKFATVFKDVAIESQRSADVLAENFGLTGTKARELLGNTGDLLSGFGFTGKAALEMATQVNELAVDLASFTNIEGGAKRASAALTSGLLGEREAMKSLGIAILETDVIARIKLLLSKGQRFESLRQAKAMATLQLATEQSKNAIGDFARTSGDLANQERITTARIQDLKESFGNALLPVALRVTKAIRSIAERLTALSPAAKKTILIVAAIAAVLGPVLLLIGSIGLALPVMAAGFAAFGAVAALALGPLGLLAGALALAAVLVINNWSKVKSFFSGFASGITATFGPTMTRLVSQFKEAARVIADLFGSDSEAATNLNNFASIGTLVGDIIGGALDIIVRGISGMGVALGQLIGAVATFDFSAFDVAAIKAEFIGGAPAAPADITGGSTVDVGINVGLDEGLKQTSAPAVSTTNTRRADVGMGTAGI